MYIDNWIRIAERYVPSRRERALIRAELYDHYNDRLEALKSTGMDPREAEKKAVATLGDPDETGRLLRKVHAPWLGYVLQALRVTLVLLILLTGYLLLHGISLQTTSRNEILQDLDILNSDERFPEERVIARQVGSCNDELDFGPFRVSCDTVSFQVRQRIHNYSDSSPYYNERQDKTFSVLLRFTGAPWFDLDLPYIRFVDDKGLEVPFEGNESDNSKPQHSGYSINRELPWRTLVGVEFRNLSEDIRWLDIYLEHKGFSEKLRIELEPWQLAVDELSQLGDGADAIRSITDYPLFYSSQLVQFRSAVTTESQQLNGLEVSIPWAREAIYQRNTDSQASAISQPVDMKRVECVLMIRGDSSKLPIPYVQKQWRIQILDPNADPEKQDLDFVPGGQSQFSDGKLYRLWWYPSPGTDRYLVRFTEPGGESCIFEINLGEEEFLP